MRHPLRALVLILIAGLFAQRLVTAQETQQVDVELPATVGEGTGPHNGRLVLAFPAASPLTITLSSTPAGQITAPATVQIAAGESSAIFAFTVGDDNTVNLTRTVTITPSATGATGVPKTITVLDNETPPTLRISMPTSVTEGATSPGFGQLTLSFTVPVPVPYSLSTDPSDQITVPVTGIIPAGAIGVSFTVRAVNDTVLDGDKLVTVTATSASFPPVSAQTTAIDNELPALALTLPGTMGEGAVAAGTVTMSDPRQSLTTITLASSSASALQVPASVTIPAGQQTATFQITAAQDSLVNLHRDVTISASGTGVTGTSAVVSLTDDEPAPIVTLTLPPTLTEGQTASNNGTIALSSPAAVAVAISLTGSPGNELTLPATISIPIGQTQATFSTSAVNDTRIDGDVLVNVTASAPGLASVNAATTTIDNESRTLSVTLPIIAYEATNVNGTVVLSGTLSADLQVTLSSGNPAALAVPPTVTIPAGQTQVSFVANAVDNTLRDGSRVAAVTAAAESFVAATRSVTIRDNDLAFYQFEGITDFEDYAAPFGVTIIPCDVEGRIVPIFSGTVNVEVVLPDGSTQPTTPATAPAASSMVGTILTLPPVSARPLKLRARDNNGYMGESSPFEPLRLLKLPARGLVWDAARGRIYASVPGWSPSPFANSIVAIDPHTMAVTASAPVGDQDPGQLEITGGGEYLYVALRSTCRVGKIDLATMSLVTTFAVGSEPSGALYAGDMCTVAGQPNVLIVLQHGNGFSFKRVAAYDNGVMRPVRTPDYQGSSCIEPSADPTIFFGYNTQNGGELQRIKLNPDGVAVITATDDVINGSNVDIRSAGDIVYSSNGYCANGATPTMLGKFSTVGHVVADPAAHRAYYLEPGETPIHVSSISAHDPVSFSLVRRLSLPTYSIMENFIRWGTHGLAFRTNSEIVFVEDGRLAPFGPTADLVTSIEATPNPASAGAPLVYTISTRNQGPSVATNVIVRATLGDNQALQNVSATIGVPSTSGSLVTLLVPELAVDASAALTLTVLPQSTGTVTCMAAVTSDRVDVTYPNNIAAKLVTVGFDTRVDAMNVLSIPANSAIYDPTRTLIWTTIPGTSSAPLGRSIVAVDPRSGIISDPIPINAEPFANSLALSRNGRYLYVGLSDLWQVHRIDLATTPVSSTRIPLGPGLFSFGNPSMEIEALDGDGTSFILAGVDQKAVVYDGATPRPNRTSSVVTRLERTADPSVFVGYYTSGNLDTTRLSVSASGVAISQTVMGLITGSSVDIRGSGNLILSSTGKLIDSNTLTLKRDFALNGRPCVDTAYQRAYLVSGNAMRSFSTADGSAAGTLSLPVTSSGDWAQTCLRWGVDGFAIFGGGRLYLTRWSGAVPKGLDLNGDGIEDAWAAFYFGTMAVNPTGDSDGDGIPDALEFLFATSPLQPTPPPFHAETTTTNGQTILHITFPRRAGLPAGAYLYASTLDLKTWQTVQNVTETVISTATVDGVQVDTVKAAISFGSAESGFVRVQWALP